MAFEIDTTGERRHTLRHFNMYDVVQPKHRLRWEYLKETVPVSVLDDMSVFVLKAAVDGCYGLSEKEREKVEAFAETCAAIPGFKVSRLGKNNWFVNMIRQKRAG